MGHHAFTQICTFTHVERKIIFSIKDVHTVAFRKLLGQIGIQMRGQRGARSHPINGLMQALRRKLLAYGLPKLEDQVRVRQCAMAPIRVKSVTGDEGVKIMAGLLRLELPRELDRAQHACTKIDPKALELVFNKSVVKPGVVGHEQRTV